MPPQVDPEFGPLIVSKKFPRELIFHTLIATLLLAMFSFMAVSSGLKPSPGTNASPGRQSAILPSVLFAGVLLAALLVFIYRIVQRVHFYDAGAVQTVFGKTVSRVAYADGVTHKFYAVDLSKNDSYQGTLTRLYLTGSNKQAVRYRAMHKLESVRNGGFFSLGFHVVGANPIEDAAWRSASAIANRWRSRLNSGESVDWNKFATLTSTGIAAWRGPSKGTMALYSELAPVAFEGTDAVLTMRDGTAFLKIPTREDNLYPGYLVACSMVDRAAPDSECVDEQPS